MYNFECNIGIKIGVKGHCTCIYMVILCPALEITLYMYSLAMEIG